MRIFFMLTVLLLSSQLIQGQNCSIELNGKVVDFHSQLNLSGAVIEVYAQGSTALLKKKRSGDNGVYAIDSLCPGPYTLVISHPDCQTITVDIAVSANLTRDFVLEHHLEELKEVEIYGSKQQDETRSAQEVKIDEDIIDKYSAASLGDALSESPGVTSLNTGVNIVKPSIHGLIGSRVVVLNNGVRMQDMEWGEEHAPNVDLNSVGSITVIKGAASLRYGGDALGGVILLQPDKLNTTEKGFSGKALIAGQTNGRGGIVSNKISQVYDSNWYYQLQGSFKLMGDSEAPDYVLSNTGIQQGALAFRLGKQGFRKGFSLDYKLFDAEIGILRASHIGNVDDLIRSINSGEPLVINPFTYDLINPRQRVTHHLGRLSYYQRFKQAGRLDINYDFQANRRLEFDIRVGDDRDKPALDLELTTHTLQLDYKNDANSNWTWETGILGRFQDNFANPDTGVRRLIPDYNRFEAGMYTSSYYRWKNSHSLDFGIRYDYSRIDSKKFYRTSRWEERGYAEEFADLVIDDLGTQVLVNPILDYHNISWSTGYQFKPNNESEFRFNFTWAQRAPNPSELFSDGLHHSAARIELGDLRIVSEKSKKFSLTWQEDKDKWSWRLEPYFNLIDDFILLTPTGAETTIRGAFPLWEYDQTAVTIAGVDVDLVRHWHPNWSSTHQFSYLYGQDTTRDIPLINMPPVSTVHTLEFRLPRWNEFRLQLRGEYVFQQNRTPENIRVFSPTAQSDVEVMINNGPPAYALFGASVQWGWKVGQGKVQLALSGTNLLNRNYRNYLNRQRFFADDLGRNIQVQLKFNY